MSDNNRWSQSSTKEIHFKRLNLNPDMILVKTSRKSKNYNINSDNIFAYLRAVISKDESKLRAEIKNNLPTKAELLQLSKLKDILNL